MFNKELFYTLFRNKLKFLFIYLSIPAGIGAVTMAVLYTLLMEESAYLSVFVLSSVLFSLLFGLFTYCILIAYRDSYLHFPMAMLTGKTRLQFLGSSLLTSLLTVFLGTGVIYFVMRFLPYTPIRGMVDYIYRPMRLFVVEQGSFGNLCLLFIYFAVILHALAALNYHFGFKIWLFIFVLNVFTSVTKTLPYMDKLYPFTRIFQLSHWTTILSSRFTGHPGRFIEMLLALLIMGILMMRMVPEFKRNPA